MSNYDTILREKDDNDTFDNSGMEKHWADLEKKLDGQIKPPSNFKRIVKAVIAVAAVAIVSFFSFKFLKHKKNKPEIATNTEIKSAIKPALTWTNLPYEKFEFDAAIGDTLFTQNGSILVFPANALLNNKGEIVQGKVEIQSREFNDALDYSIAGIPMVYDSAGIKYTFISSGMIDIKANQNGETLQVNPEAKPTLNLVSTNREKNTNLYKLDTVTGVWTNKGKDILSYVKNDATNKNLSGSIVGDAEFFESQIRKDNNDEEEFFEDEKEMVKPLPPQKPSNKNSLINIEFVPGSFKELAIYDGLKFEVISQYFENKNTSFEVKEVQKVTAPKSELKTPVTVPIKKEKSVATSNPAVKNNQLSTTNTTNVIKDGKQPTFNNLTESVARNSKIYWENIELIKTNTEGEYRVIFTSGQQKVVYVVKPVLEGTAYAAAEKVYQQKITEYEKIKNNRLQDLSKKENENNEQIKKDSIEEAQVIAQNKKVYAKNIKIKEQDKLTKERNKLVEARNKFRAEQNKLIQDPAIVTSRIMKELEIEQSNSTDLLRSFTIDGFGYWNCDRPTLPAPIFYVQTSCFDRKNELLEITTLHVAVQNINRLLNSNKNILRLLPNQPQCVFAFANDKFYYLSYNQFAKLNITTATKSFHFILNEFTGDKNDYNSLKKLLVEPAG